jgi:hypothetical protein
MHYRVNVKTATGLNGFTRVTARQAPIVGGWEIDSRVVPAHAEVLPLPPEAPV